MPPSPVELARERVSGMLRRSRTKRLQAGLAGAGLDPLDSILLCAEARSGSTWLLELFHQIPGTVCSWEPLHPEKGILPSGWEFGWRPYVPEDDPGPEVKAVFDELFAFRVANDWTLRYVDRRDVAAARLAVFKFVRVNLLLPWLTSVYRFRRPPVLLLRHPIATVLSRADNFSIKSLGPYTPPAIRNNDLWVEHAEYLDRCRRPLDRMVARWCITTRPGLTHPRAGRDWLLVHYEHLVQAPHQTFTTLLDGIDLAVAADELSAIDFRRPSRSDFKGTTVADPSEQLDRWRSRLDADDIRRVQAILDDFGVECYRADDPYPTTSAP